jgi:hypothetical protein
MRVIHPRCRDAAGRQFRLCGGHGGVRVLEGWNDDQTDIATNRVKLNGARATRGGYEAAGES